MNPLTKSPQGQPPKTRFGVNMEIVIAIIVSLVAIAAIVGSRRFPGTGLSTDIGSARFPLVYSIALLVLSAILIAQNLCKRSPAAPQAAAAEIELPDYWKPFSGILATAFCIAAMPYTGYLITSALYMSFLMWLLGMKHKALNPLLTLAITAAIYLTFSVALKVPLPIGSFFENPSA